MMQSSSVELNKKLVSQDDDALIEKVDYHMQSLALLTDKEIKNIKSAWAKLLNESQDLFENIFLQVLSLDESSKLCFVNIAPILIPIDKLMKTKEVKEHTRKALEIMNEIVEKINNPNDNWMVEVLKIATVHKLYNVAPSSLRVFKRAFLGALGSSIKGDEDATDKREAWERVLDSVLACMNEYVDDTE